MRRIMGTDLIRRLCRCCTLGECLSLLMTARLATDRGADQPGGLLAPLSPKTQGGSLTAMLIAAVIGFSFIIGVPLLTSRWEERHPRPTVPSQPAAGPAAPRIPARYRPFLVAGVGLFAVPMLTFACGIIAAGLHATHAVQVILACGLVFVALDAALLALLAIVASVTTIRARQHRSGIVVS